MSWCTSIDVLNMTGIAVSQDNIDAAQFIIEMLADTTEDSGAFISSRNLRLLKLAVAYQSAWQTEHPDVFTTLDVRSVTTDGMSWTVDNPQAGVVAPLARMAISRLSWKRNRSIYIRPRGGRQNYVPQTLNTTDVNLDERRTDWRPLDDSYGL